MIGVRLMGGLGNQMFQYALGKAVSTRLGTPLFLDMIFYENLAEIDTPRHYELDCFNLVTRVLPAEQRPNEDLASLYIGKRGKLLKIKHQVFGPPWKIYREPHHNFDPKALTRPDKTYFIGFWQSEKYFLSIREQLLADFTFRELPSKKNQKLIETVRNTNSVAVHVRRGDYVANPHANKFHGLKGQDYYDAALRQIKKRQKNIELFVISDDPEWCKKNLSFDFPTTYVSGNKKGSEDMRLMMNCKHNITANSSFSWWAAWLNQNPDKIVVSPKAWFNEPGVDTSDIVPSSWIKI